MPTGGISRFRYECLYIHRNILYVHVRLDEVIGREKNELSLFISILK